MGRDPCRRQTGGLRRGLEGEGHLWHRVEPRPWEATCQPGISQRERRGAPTAAQGATWQARPWQGRGGGWTVSPGRYLPAPQ